MPLYEYQCRACGKDFEILTTSISHQPQAVCPHCGADDARKQLSVSSNLRPSASQAGGAACQPRGGFS